MRRFAVILLVSIIAWATVPRGLVAQEPHGVQPELRLDGVAPHPAEVDLGAGPELALGWYTRLALIAGVGVADERATTVGSARGDAIVRFLLDPFRESRWGLSVGGGVSVRYDPVRRWREYLALVADVELPAHGALMPSFQVGLGGGVRLGVGLRRAVPGRR